MIRGRCNLNEENIGQPEDPARGVPQRREKRFGNGVKNLSGSADIPKVSNMSIIQKEMLSQVYAGLFFAPAFGINRKPGCLEGHR
jgi:hypothetical protein